MTRAGSALVTGAGSGLGAAIAQALGARGYAVTCTGRRPDRVAAVADAVVEAGGEAVPVALDVADSTHVEHAMQAAAAHWGRLDVLVNNAGIFRSGEVIELSDEAWAETLQTNLTGAFYCARAAARLMATQPPLGEVRGHIVNINSGAGLHGYATGSAYAASKFGLLGLSDTLREELGARLIKITDVIVATAVESDLSNRVGVLRLPASTVGQVVADAVTLPGRAVISRVDLEQLPRA